jgi:hypothetical protein
MRMDATLRNVRQLAVRALQQNGRFRRQSGQRSARMLMNRYAANDPPATLPTPSEAMVCFQAFQNLAVVQLIEAECLKFSL